MTELELNARLEHTLKELIDQQLKLEAYGIEPHLIAGAVLALGISRFGAVMGESSAALVLEQAAADLRLKSRALH